MPRYGRDSVDALLVRRQTDFNTPETAGAGKFVRLPVYRNTLGDRQDLFEDKVLGDGRQAGEALLGFRRHDGEIEAPVRSQSFGWHLAAMFGAPVTTADTPSAGLKTHVFTSGGAPGPFTCGRQVGDVHFGDIGVTWNEMRLRLARQAQTQRATFGCLGRNEVKLGAVYDSAPVAFANADDLRFMAYDGGVTFDGSTVGDLVDLDMTVSHQMTHDDEAISGEAWALRLLEGDFMVRGNVRFRFEDATRYDLGRQGTLFDLVASWTSGDHSLTLRLHNMIVAADRAPLEGGGVLTYNLSIMASKPDPGDATVTATLVNNVAGYANPTP